MTEKLLCWVPPEPDERPDAEDKQRDRPSPWHDDSFFAALPSAPEQAGGDTQGDRYGANAVAPPAEAPAADGPGEESPPKPKRRRRRRRRRAGSAGTAAEAESPETAEPDPSGSDEVPLKE